ncbi:hypothetical protein Nepgr_033528 [Nepenthes gracilis]|uniref:Uncharacterized protein n=1 Tax=Nepenthes gracilis TaxID=150966 RepID=A0AAD3TM79_NEPGR|nr:hypothetical protein Nepgr_033528 [Nepenthes gracilis]
MCLVPDHVELFEALVMVLPACCDLPVITGGISLKVLCDRARNDGGPGLFFMDGGCSDVEDSDLMVYEARCILKLFNAAELMLKEDEAGTPMALPYLLPLI